MGEQDVQTGGKDKGARTKKEEQEGVRSEERVSLVWDVSMWRCFLDTQVKIVHQLLGVWGLNSRERTKTPMGGGWNIEATRS